MSHYRCGKPRINADGDISPATGTRMPEPGWGRITDSHQWNTLLVCITRNFIYYNARQRLPAAAHPVVGFDHDSVDAPSTAKTAYGVTLPTSVLFIAGHDTNLQISAAHWSSTGRFQVSRITRARG